MSNCGYPGQIDKDIVRRTHFGGFSDDDNDDAEEDEQVCHSLPCLNDAHEFLSPKEKNLKPRSWRRLLQKVKSIRCVDVRFIQRHIFNSR